MLLRDFVEQHHYNFVEDAGSWKNSIHLACQPLINDNTVDTEYPNEIIDCVSEHGPYIVIVPGVAIPHSMEGAKGVQRTAISFMKTEKPVIFDENDPEKYAKIFFTLACVNPEEHLKNMRKLFKMLTDEALLVDLMTVKCPKDLLELDEKYFGG